MARGCNNLIAIGIVCLVGLLPAPGASLATAGPAQDATEVTAVVSRIGEAPLPKIGRPVANLSPEQLEGRLCAARAGGNRAEEARVAAAYKATVDARQVRRRSFNGEAGEREMAAAELARQRAVALINQSLRDTAFRNTSPDGLRIEVRAFRVVFENAHKVVLVDGTVRNPTSEQVELPPVTLGAIDVSGFSLAAQTAQLDSVFIAPRSDMTFQMRFQNPPDYTVKIVAAFAPPFAYRAFRGCEPSVPPPLAGIQPAALSTSRPGEPAVPPYSVGELALMEMWARQDAEAAYSLGDAMPCDRPGARFWRNDLTLADRLGEALVATRAVQEIRADAARGVFTREDIEAAEMARITAVRAALSVRSSKTMTPPEYVGYTIENYRVRPIDGAAFEVTGRMTNTTAIRKQLPVLRILALDRYGVPVSEWFYSPIKRTGNPAFSFHFSAPAPLVSRVQVDVAC